MFAWLVIYQGMPMKAHLAKSGLSDDCCIVCQKVENVKNILWECSFVRSHWDKVQSLMVNVL